MRVCSDAGRVAAKGPQASSLASGSMAVMRIACCVCVALLCSARGAARPSGGRRARARARTAASHARTDRSLAPDGRARAACAARRARPRAQPPRRGKHRTVIGELKRLRDAGRDRRPTTYARAPRRLRGRQAPRRASCTGARKVELRRGACARSRASPRAAQLTRLAAGAAVADARAQPRVVDHRRRCWPPASASASRAPSSSGSTTPARASSSRCSATSASSTASGARATNDRARPGCSTSCSRSPPSAPAASRGSTTSRSAAAARRGSAASRRAPRCRRSRARRRGCTARPRCCRRQPRAGDLRGADARGRARARAAARRALRALLVRPAACASSTASSSR